MATTFSQRQKYEQLTMPVISILFVLVLTATVLVPQFKSALDDRKKIAEFKEGLTNLDKKSEVLSNLDAAELNIKTGKLYKAIPANQDLAYYISAIRSMARRAGVEFTGIDLERININKREEAAKARRQNSADNSVNLSVLLSGELNRLHEFLYQIETSIPLALIKEFSFTKNAASSGLNAKLILDFYFLLDPEEIGKVTDPVSVVTAADEKEYDRIESLSEPEVISLPRVPVGNPDLMP